MLSIEQKAELFDEAIAALAALYYRIEPRKGWREGDLDPFVGRFTSESCAKAQAVLQKALHPTP